MADAENAGGRYKFTYFPAPGRCETAKLCMAMGNFEFTEEIVMKEWAKLKPKTQWGSMPFMTCPDGSIVGQSRAMTRLCAKKAGLYPTNKIEAAQVDAIYDLCEDILMSMSKKKKENDDAERKSDFAEGGKIRLMFQRMDDYIGSVGKGFAVGSCLTMADLAIFVYANNITSGFFDHYPDPSEAFKGMNNLNKIRMQVIGIPAVKARYAADFPGKESGGFQGFINAMDMENASETKCEAGKWDEDQTSKTTITYFPAPGRAELSRVLYAMAGVEFDDVMLSGEQWGELKVKGTVPLGNQLPFLTLADGTMLTQSLAFARYVAKCTGMYPEDPILAQKTDAIVDACVDCAGVNYKAKDKAPLWAEGGKCAMLMGKVEAFIKDAGTCAVGDNMTWADVAIWVTTASMTADYGAWSKVQEVRAAVAKNENVVARYKAMGDMPDMFKSFVAASGMEGF